MNLSWSFCVTGIHILSQSGGDRTRGGCISFETIRAAHMNVCELLIQQISLNIFFMYSIVVGAMIFFTIKCAEIQFVNSRVRAV